MDARSNCRRNLIFYHRKYETFLPNVDVSNDNKIDNDKRSN